MPSFASSSVGIPCPRRLDRVPPSISRTLPSNELDISARFANDMYATKEVKQLGNSIAFVLPAYIFVFALWNAASSYDYISSKWLSVRIARRHGMRHLCVLILPMLYMVVYIKFQHDADDPKEMSAGIMALLFACVEFCRAIDGLWQLHVFRHWVAASIRSLESLGYVAGQEESNSDGKGKSPKNVDVGEVGTADRERSSPLEIADGLNINDLVVDNRLSEGEIQCVLRMRNSRPRTSLGQRLCSSWHWMSCVWYFPRLLVAICRSRESFFTSPASAVFLQPYDAEDIYTRWACILVAQVFPLWLQDMHKWGMSDMSSKDGLKELLGRFHRGVLCSAALHTQRGIYTAESERVEESTSGVEGHSLLDFKVSHDPVGQIQSSTTPSFSQSCTAFERCFELTTSKD